MLRAISILVLFAVTSLVVSEPPAAAQSGDGTPSIRGQTDSNQVWLTDWPAGAVLNVVVDSDEWHVPGDPSTYLLTTTVVADAKGEVTAHFDEKVLVFQPGHHVTATDGVTTKELHVPQLEVYVNDLTGEVYGTTDLPSVEGNFSLFAFPDSGEVFRDFPATASWSSNLATPPVGPYDVGQMMLPLPAGLQGSLMQNDADDDQTEIRWFLVWRGIFRDDDDSVFESNIDRLASAGITRGCNPPINDLFCPDDNVTRGQMAAFLVRAAWLSDRLSDPFTDDDGSIFESEIERLAAAGITRGCNPPENDRFCPDDLVTREQMAAFLVRAMGYTDAGNRDMFVDDNGSVFETDISRLAVAGVTLGCNPPVNDRFCPAQSVTRGQMAAFLNRALED